MIAEKKYFSALLSALCFVVSVMFSGCGGGGGGAPAPSSAAAPVNYVSINRVAADVGPNPVIVAYGDVVLIAALPLTQNVSIIERFYTSGKPAGVIGKIYDILPDNLQFSAGTRFCFSVPSGIYSADDLVMATGLALDQPVPGSSSATGQVCAPLTHSGPYALILSKNLQNPGYTTFGSIAEDKKNYPYKVTTRTENNEQWGTMFIVNIKVNCDLKCMNSGEREFSFMSGKADQNGVFDPLPDDLFIRDDSAYQLWKDMNKMTWTHLRTSDKKIEGGIAYLLAAEYVKYFTGGSGKMDGYIAELDPKEIAIQRFVYDAGPRHMTMYIEIIRNEKDLPGIIKIYSKDTNQKNGLTYLLNRSTASITKKSITADNTEKFLTAVPGDAGYDALNQEALNIVQIIVSLSDHPDETKGNAGDNIPRMSPAHELFAVNALNLLKGCGWNNLVEIETYYRARLKTWKNDQP